MADLVGNPEDRFSHNEAHLIMPVPNDMDSYHHENTSMHYLAIFHGCKNDNFQMKNCDIFLIFAQNIDCRFTLEPPQ